MKGTVAIVGAIAVAVIVAAVIIPRMTGSKTAATGAVTTAETNDADRIAADSAADEARLAAERDKRIEDAALARLEKELEEAEPYTGKTDEQRLEEAWAWVHANRDPNNPYNELEAKLLSLWAAMLDGERQSAAWLMNASLIEIEMTRALDADGDGQVTDEEIQAFIDSGISDLNGMSHPYLVERLDTDGDGTVSEEEQAVLLALMGENGAFAGVIERARLDLWDANGDGILSEAEAQQGRATGSNFMEDLVQQQLKAMEESGAFDGDDGDARREEFQKAMEEQLASTDNEQMRQLNEMMIAQDLMEAMRLETMDASQLQAEVMADMPQSPDYLAFDTDGDGEVNGGELAAWGQAQEQYAAELEAWQAEATARTLRAQFENATRESDANGDGRLTPDEWERRVDELLAKRDQRLFKKAYDLDQDGVVRSEELMTYLDWHKEGSLRADANFDGVVDPRDLEFMMINYQRQEP